MTQPIAHEFPDGDDPAKRCVHCGTTWSMHEAMAQPCVPRRPQGGEALRPEPARREYAVDDADVIGARLIELRAERDAAINRVEPD